MTEITEKNWNIIFDYFDKMTKDDLINHIIERMPDLIAKEYLESINLLNEKTKSWRLNDRK